MKQQRHLDRRVSALDPLADASRYGRHRPWDIEGRALEHRAACPRRPLVRNAGARRTALGPRHHAARRVVRGRHARHPHAGGALRRDREVRRRLLLRLDTLGARRARGLHLHPLGAWTVESATGPTEVVHALTNPHCRRRARDCSWRRRSLGDEGRDDPPPQRAVVRLRHARHGHQRLDPGAAQRWSDRRKRHGRPPDALLRRHGVDDGPPRVTLDPRDQFGGADGRGNTRALPDRGRREDEHSLALPPTAFRFARSA